ncbi:DUF4393 domain-containing protein [Sphingobium sp. AS12]|uniref:DUF4393 domain-containing protein n=1 Tax=Sphingobium sp. AS12 TaxID=2849495 RepID=UPI001C31A2DC|nr:DUF4393 domain-containing protein [Sphingobium sp. AS12]MBV2150170.1 DUF4393 domain-containing protein [Sphingobium sp. AS12]
MLIDPTEIVKGVSEPFTNSLSDAWQWLLGDRIAASRLKNAAKLQVKVNAELANVGLKLVPAKIPERYAFAWFEEATKQDEPEIQTLFARLLAKAALGDEDALDRRHLEIVSRLVPMDAQIMNVIFSGEFATTHLSSESEVLEIRMPEPSLYMALKERLGPKAWQSVEHLLALGVLEKYTLISKDSVARLLGNLQTDRSSGLVYPSYGTSDEIVTETEIVVTDTGFSLKKALSDI